MACINAAGLIISFVDSRFPPLKHTYLNLCLTCRKSVVLVVEPRCLTRRLHAQDVKGVWSVQAAFPARQALRRRMILGSHLILNVVTKFARFMFRLTANIVLIVGLSDLSFLNLHHFGSQWFTTLENTDASFS